MTEQDRSPARGRNAFNCPHCDVYAHQTWGDVYLKDAEEEEEPLLEFHHLAFGRCVACRRLHLWYDQSLIYPPSTKAGPVANDDMPQEVRDVYEEARTVAPLSAKSTAGLLRLALQLLVDDLEPAKGTINTKIGILVGRGLDPAVQQAMDVLRVVGNNAVHPGQIDLGSDEALVPALFDLVNIVVEQLVARPRRIAELFAALPPEQLEAIAKRDGSIP